MDGARASALPSWQLGMRALCDLELLATGAFSPLAGFMREADYRRCWRRCGSPTGRSSRSPSRCRCPRSPRWGRDSVMLRDSRNEPVAVLAVEEVFERDPDEARIVAGTEDTRHPLVAEMARWPSRYASGTLRVLGKAAPRLRDAAPHAARGAPPAGRARARAWSRSRRGTPSTARTSG